MIISIRGASGSGKSTVVRRILDLCPRQTVVDYPPEEHRRRPQGQVAYRSDNRPIFVPGHYLIANGGIDTLPSLEYAYRLMVEYHEQGCEVIAEGKCMSDGVARVKTLQRQGLDMRVVLLSTSLEDCVASVRERGHSISERTISRTHAKCLRDLEEFARLRVRTIHASREDATREIRRWLSV